MKESEIKSLSTLKWWAAIKRKNSEPLPKKIFVSDEAFKLIFKEYYGMHAADGRIPIFVCRHPYDKTKKVRGYFSIEVYPTSYFNAERLAKSKTHGTK